MKSLKITWHLMVTVTLLSSLLFSSALSCAVYSRYGKRNATSFTRSELDDYKFYYGDSDYGDYDLDELSFVADKSFSDSIEIAFTAYGGRGSKENDSVSGTLKITSSKSASSSKGDITYTVKAGEEVAFDDADFEKIYENSRCTGSLKYVEFSRPDSAFNNAGTLYSRCIVNPLISKESSSKRPFTSIPPVRMVSSLLLTPPLL